MGAPGRGQRTRPTASPPTFSHLPQVSAAGAGDAFRAAKLALHLGYRGQGGVTQRPGRGHLALPMPHQLPLCTTPRLRHPGLGQKEIGDKESQEQPLSRTLNFLPGSEIRAEISPLLVPPRSPATNFGHRRERKGNGPFLQCQGPRETDSLLALL